LCSFVAKILPPFYSFALSRVLLWKIKSCPHLRPLRHLRFSTPSLPRLSFAANP
jgi:hypothetical protein